MDGAVPASNEESNMSQFALIRADLNSNQSEILSTHETELAAESAADAFADTTGEIGLYVARKLASGEWESRLEARDRREAAL
ncbi:MAG TPA: hypothetical protein VF457_15685 [Burkholderiaceae bacterium]